MSSSCISGGSRPYPYGLELDLQVIKSPSTSTWTSSHSSSPSSTLSESSNSPSPIAISTRKARTPRKRPNQTYNEAAALLSTAYPQIFCSKQLLLAKPPKFTQPHSPFSCQFPSDDLLLHFPVLVAESPGFLLQEEHLVEKPSFPFGPKVCLYSPCEKPCQSPGENESRANSSEFYHEECQEDFDAESILDEEINEGIDCIMGNLSMNANSDACCSTGQMHHGYGFPMGHLESRFGMRTTMGVNAFRNVDDYQWESRPRFPIVDILDIIPKFNKTTSPPAVENKSKKKKKKKIQKLEDLKCSGGGAPIKGNSVVIPNPRTPKNEDTNFHEHSIVPQHQGYNSSKKLLLNLNYDEVLSAWSGRGSPLPDDGEIQGSESSAEDIHARLMQIDLFSENGGGVREASVLRYKEKRRTRLFSRKIRYQVRKVNADRRPRMKGRFVRRPNSPTSDQ